MEENKENTGRESPEPGNSLKDPSVVILTIIGTLVVLLAFYILYRGERTVNKQWIVKKAKLIDPQKPGSSSGMVRFTGFPAGDLAYEDLTKEQFVFFERALYEYRKVKKEKTVTVTRDGRPELATKTVWENEWVFVTAETRLADDLKIGMISVRLGEAELMGKREWQKSIYFSKSGRHGMPGAPEKPALGDRRFDVSGIPARGPIFAAGNLANGFLASGAVFILSAYSEGKTIDELQEFFIWRWMRHPVCFVLLFVGLIVLIHPAMLLLQKHAQMPVIGVFSRLGWVSFILVSFALSLIIVVFSSVTVELLWVIIAVIVGVPLATFLRNKIRAIKKE